MTDVRRGVLPEIDDPQVLEYWREWLMVRDSKLATGWSFAAYIVARAAQEEPRFYTTGGSWPPPGESA